MKATPASTADRFRRYQRDLRAYRQRSLWRRSHARFRTDLEVHPHLFLAPDLVRAADLLEPPERILDSLRERAIWTLDTASRLACGIGFLTATDLTAYMSREDFDSVAAESLVLPNETPSISVTPTWSRPQMLIAHFVDDPPPNFALGSGDRVVTWRRLMADIKGTLGWRPDLLTRLEAAYVHAEESVVSQQKGGFKA